MANIKVLVVGGGGAGGGGGSTYANGGGGGAAGLRLLLALEVLAQEYDVIIGSGATGGAAYTSAAANGSPSSFGTIVALGGNSAPGWSGAAPSSESCGSGSGGAGYSQVRNTGNAGTEGQGHSGGAGVNSPGSTGNGAGGGGYNGAGGDASGSNGGVEGAGLESDISGTIKVYAKGGHGGGYSNGNTNGADADANTGNGGHGANATGAGGGTAGGAGGSGIVIIRYATDDFGSCTGGTITTSGTDTIHTFTASGTFTVVEKVSAYKSSGTATFPPYILPTMTVDPESSSIAWTEDIPTGTSLVIKAVIADTTPQESDYQTVTNGGAIPDISQLSSGKNLYIKAYLSTTDVTKTPKLLTLKYTVIEQPDTTKVKLTLTDTGRMKCPAGDVTVSYSKSAGNLTGLQGGQADSFEQVFTPLNIEEVFNPNDPEYINVTLTQTTELKRVYYEEYQAGAEYISVTLSQTTQLIKVSDIPQ